MLPYSLIPRRLACLLLGVSALLAWPVAATSTPGCEHVHTLDASDAAAVKLPFGEIPLASEYLQPDNTLLGSVVVPSSSYTANGTTPDTVLWACPGSAILDGKVYFLVAINGDHRFVGHQAVPGGDSVYFTQMQHVGLRQTMDGVRLTRHWQKVELQSYAEDCGDPQGRFCIRLKDIPPLHAELVRIGQLPLDQDGTMCGEIIEPTTEEQGISCQQPSAYLQLVGPGLTHDDIGEDSASAHKFKSQHNGVGYTLRDGVSFYAQQSCSASSSTSHVFFEDISKTDLEAGKRPPEGAFTVQVICDPTPSENQIVYLGIQVSNEAYLAATKLVGKGDTWLMNESRGVGRLLSDQYGTEGVATGVGIRLFNDSGNTVVSRWFVGSNPADGHHDGAGWYPAIKDKASGGWRLNYTVKLARFPDSSVNKTITPGKVHATATVLVRIK